MKVSRAKFDAHNEAIGGIAAWLFRERGFNVVVPSDVRTAAGLTHGTF